MKTVSDKMSSDWAEAYQFYSQTRGELSHPTETLIRLFKGDYVTGEKIEYQGKSILDVGFGNGNNTMLFASLGMEVSGVEIHQDICELVNKKFLKIGIEVDLQVGTNQDLPFDDNTFDFLVSWNVLHYEGDEEGIKAGIKEYARVLKPNGRLFLSTTGPKHKILKNGKSLGNHLYEIGRDDDFRKGQIHFFFDSENYLDFYFSPHFKEIKTGRIEDQLFREKLDWWLLTGVKP
jgi:ubiquinone/menaquinone biosynthesis C-methylase UbiE